MLTEKEVNHIANLARIKLTDGEIDRFKKELSSIIQFIDQLNEVSVEGVQPLYQTTGLTSALRADVHRGDFPMDEKLNKLLVGQAPHQHDRYVKVQSVKKKS